MTKKGQAAMEFLMTYGWAILAAIIVIGVLAIYFRPSGLSGGQSSLNAPLYLQAAGITAGGSSNVDLEIRNDGGQAIVVASGNSKATLNDGLVNCSGPSADVPVSSGAHDQVTLGTCTSNLVSGQEYTGTLTISYTVGGSTVEQTTTGRFFGTPA